MIKQKTTVVGAGKIAFLKTKNQTEGQVPPSTSLMIRGNAIKETDEGEVIII